MCAKKVSGQQPEALALLGAAARSGGKKPAGVGLTATKSTAPVATDPKKKQDAAKKVLAKGATGKATGAKAAMAKLPDRTKAGKSMAPAKTPAKASDAKPKAAAKKPAVKTVAAKKPAATAKTSKK